MLSVLVSRIGAVTSAGVTVLALSAMWSAAPAEAAAPAAPAVTCNGHQSSSISPGITDTPAAQSGTVTFTEGADDGLSGLLGFSTCESADGTITGATMTQDFKTVAACNQTSEQTSFTGLIDWDNGQTSTLTNGSFEFSNRDNGDTVITLTADISAGEFNGMTLTGEINADTTDPAACENRGITSDAGTNAIIIR
jgi:hypothetical protein